MNSPGAIEGTLNWNVSSLSLIIGPMDATVIVFALLYFCAIAIHSFLALLILRKTGPTREESAYGWFMTICAFWHVTNLAILTIVPDVRYFRLILILNHSLLAFMVGGLIHIYAVHEHTGEEERFVFRKSISRHIAENSRLYVGLSYAASGVLAIIMLADFFSPGYLPAAVVQTARKGVLYFFLAAAVVVVATRPSGGSVGCRSFLHSPATIKMSLAMIAALSAFYILRLVGVESVKEYIEPPVKLISVPFAFGLALLNYRFQFMDKLVRHSIRVLFFLTLSACLYWFLSTAHKSLSRDLQSIVAIVLLFSLLFLAPMADRLIRAMVDSYLLKRPLNLGQAVLELDQILSVAKDVNGLQGNVASHIRSVLLTQSVSVELCETANPAAAAADPPHKDSVRSEPGKHIGELVFPLTIENRPLGHLVVCERENGYPYLSEEVSFLRTAATLLAASLDAHLAREEQIKASAELKEGGLREDRLVAEAARAELRALRAQINPHFLFNVLSTIADLISYEPEKAEAMTERLAEVFRYILAQTDRDSVPLGDELEFIKAYLDIQKIRFGDRLDVRLAIEPSVLHHQIPPLLLQPIVENSIKHGLAPKVGGGCIQIRAAEEFDQLRIVIEDDGIGMLPAEDSLHRGVGLKNVRDRLYQAYGVRGHLVIRGEYQKGTIVEIGIPKL